MKKWLAITCAAVCVVTGGLWYADYRVKEAIGNQVASVLSDPNSQAEINNIVNSAGNGVSNQLAGAIGNELGNASATNSTGGSSGQSGASGGSARGGSSGTNSSGGANGAAGSNASGSGSNGSNRVGNATGGQSAAPTFTSRQQVINYAMNKFTTAQISKYAYEYAHRSALTQAEKNQIKADILSRFTPAEIAAMRAAADKYK